MRRCVWIDAKIRRVDILHAHSIYFVHTTAAAAAIAAFVLIRKPSAPVDSFDDPMLAYAQIEHTFQYISDKMSGGLNLVREAGPIVEKPGQIINKINEK